MKISVLMSVYHKEKPEYLTESLESMVNQTLQPAQIVIVKDGKVSKELEAVLKNFKKRFSNMIDIYQKETNNGLGEALRFGLEKCKYEYVARMDTDDIAPLYRFEKQIEVLKNNPKLDVLGGYIEEYDEKMEKIISVRKVPLLQKDINKYVKTQCPFNHGTVIMKKEVIVRNGSYNNTMLEDYDLWVRLVKNNCVMANMDIILAKNRTGESMYARRSGIKQIKKVLEIEKKLLKYKIINKPLYLFNVFSRSIFALFPIKTKKFLYANIVRKIKTK